MKLFLKPLAIALLSTSLIACSDNDDDETNLDKSSDIGTVVDVAVANGSFTTLVTALQATDLDEVLANTAGKFTVFAPTDAAFDALPDGTLNALLADPDRLSDILLYHVVSGSEIDSAAATAAVGSTVTTANGDEIAVTSNGTDLLINAARVATPDVEASNGVIHVIDSVLIPTEDDAGAGNIASVATNAGSFTTLLNALVATGLDSTITGDGPFTVFAPTDAAFAAIDTSGLSTDQLRDILLYHVVSGKEINAAAATALAGNTVEMANGDDLALSLSGSELFANLSSVATPNVDASNGIIHAIDTVMLPPSVTESSENIVNTAITNGSFTKLVAALQATGLDSTLSGSGPFTVFAPTDAAFDALQTALSLSDAQLLALPNLSDILTKHVVAGSVGSVTAFTLNGTDVTTVNGETVAIAIDSGSFTVDGAQVTTFDIETSNGIIHVIDSVILLD